MKYLKYFNSLSEYNSFRESDAFIKPNVSHIKNEDVVEFHPMLPSNFIVLKYNVTDASVAHTLFGPIVNPATIHSIHVDGAQVATTSTYTFDSIGEHNVTIYLNEEVVNFERYFYGATMTECDLTHFRHENITSLYATFYNCFNMESLIIPENFAANNQSLYATFYKNYKLSNLNFSNFNVSNVNTMYGTFYACADLTEIDLSSWDTSNVTNMSMMFYMCGSLTKVTMTGDVSKVTNALKFAQYSAGGNADELLFGTLYYNDEYDYSIIINNLPTDWTAVPLSEMGLTVNEINLAQVTTYAPSTGSNDEVVMISFIPQYPPASDLTIATSVEIRDVLDNTAIVNENVTIPAGSEGVRQEFSDALAYPQFLNRIISAECTPLKDSTYKYVVTF